VNKMLKFWTSWYTGNYADEGCTKPPFEFWVTGQLDRAVNGEVSPDREDLTVCAIIDAESQDTVWKIVSCHFPDFRERFCDEKSSDFSLGDRFQ